MSHVCRHQHTLALGDHLLGAAVVDVCGREQADAGVVVLVVVPVEQPAEVSASLLNGTKALREVGPVLDGLEGGLGVGVVVAWPLARATSFMRMRPRSS